MSALLWAPCALLLLCVAVSFLVDPDRIPPAVGMAYFGLASLLLFYLALYALLSLGALPPPRKAAWALGLPAGLALLLSPLSFLDGGMGMGFIRTQVPVVYLLTIPGQVVLAPGMRWAAARAAARAARVTPDPCAHDPWTLLRSRAFRVAVRDVALPPDGGVLLLATLEGGGHHATVLARVGPDGVGDPAFGAARRCLPSGLVRLEVAPAGEVLVHGPPGALLLSPRGEPVVELGPSQGLEGTVYRFDPAGLLWSLTVHEAGGGTDPLVLTPRWAPTADALPPPRDVRPHVSGLGPLTVTDFFFLDDGDVALLGQTVVEGGGPVLLRVRADGDVRVVQRPSGPAAFRGRLDDGRLLLAEPWPYTFRADLLSWQGAHEPHVEGLARGRVQVQAAAALGPWLVLAGAPPPEGGAEDTGLALVRLRVDGRGEADLHVHTP